MPAFATAEDLATYIQRDLTAAETATATFLLDMASAAVVAETGQEFTQATTTVKLKVRGGRVRLPQAPVTAVTAITTTAATPVAVTYTWTTGQTVWLSTSLPVGNLAETYNTYAPTWWLNVTYTHGYATIPFDIKAVVLQAAGRAMGTTAAEGGMSSETIGSYSYTVGTIAASGPVGFLPSELAVLRRYKLPVAALAMM